MPIHKSKRVGNNNQYLVRTAHPTSVTCRLLLKFRSSIDLVGCAVRTMIA